MTNLPAVRSQQVAPLQEGEYEFLLRIVKNVADTDFVPKGLRNNGPACLACVLYGRALGLDPMIALREVSMIDGQPSLSAVLIMGRVIEAGHTVYVTESTNERCTIYGKRGDNGAELTITWTIEEAAKILTYVRGERVPLTQKDNWRNYPRAMLRSRAATEIGRSLFPDVFSGMTLYTADELGAAATDEEGRPLEGVVEDVATDPPGATEIQVTPHEPTVVHVEPVQPQPETPPAPAEPPAAPTAEASAAEEPVSPGPARQGEGQPQTPAAPQPAPMQAADFEEQVQAAIRKFGSWTERMWAEFLGSGPPGLAGMTDAEKEALDRISRGPELPMAEDPPPPDDAVAAAIAEADREYGEVTPPVVADDPNPEVSVAELAARAQAAQMSAPPDLRPQAEHGVVPGQDAIEAAVARAEAKQEREAELTFEQEVARDTDITDLHTWNMQDLRKLAARVGVKSRELKKPELLAELRVAVHRLRASIPALAGAVEGPPSAGEETPAPPVAAHVSPSPAGPVAEPAAPPHSEPEPYAGDFAPPEAAPFVAPTAHTLLPPLPEGATIQQPFRSLGDDAKRVLIDAVIQFSQAHFPDRSEWSRPLVILNAQKAWGQAIDGLEDLAGWQMEAIWRAVPDDVKQGLAVHYTSGNEGSLL